jgi:hypothetical protein
MVFSGRITESAAATKTFTTLRVERRCLTTHTRSIQIANISTVSVGTHVSAKPRGLYWLLVILCASIALGSLRPDLTFGPLAPNGATVVFGILMAAFAVLALRPDDKTHYLLISSNDGVLSRFTARDRALLDEVRNILTDKINRADDSMVFSVNFEKGQIDNVPGGGPPLSQHAVNGSGHAPPFGGAQTGPERHAAQHASPRPRPGASDTPMTGGRSPRPQSSLTTALNGVHAPAAESFVDYASVLPAIVEMHRFYARQPGTQHLEQRLSELELLMRAGTPTSAQKTRLRELSGDMSQILAAYPQAVELFEHIGALAP